MSHIKFKLKSLQVKIEELDRWKNKEKSVPGSLPTIKTYDIRLHTLDTNDYQELDSKFEEKSRQNLAGMMELYEK